MVNWNQVNRNTVWTWFSHSHINIWYSSNFNLKLIKQNGRKHPSSLPTSFRTSKCIHLKHSSQISNNPNCCNPFINSLKLWLTPIPKNLLHRHQCSLKKKSKKIMKSNRKQASNTEKSNKTNPLGKSQHGQNDERKNKRNWNESGLRTRERKREIVKYKRPAEIVEEFLRGENVPHRRAWRSMQACHGWWSIEREMKNPRFFQRLWNPSFG